MVLPLALVRGSSLFRVGFGSPANLLLQTRFSPSSYYWKKSSRRGLCFALEPDDVARLAGAARISLSPEETRDFAPKISQIIEWFGKLQAVNLESIEPSLRADAEVTASLREDMPEVFGNRESILEEIPSYIDPYIKVPKILNKE